jgi:hypothetical protein
MDAMISHVREENVHESCNPDPDRYAGADGLRP